VEVRNLKKVARMERSVIRDRLIPDYASLHPGYGAVTSGVYLPARPLPSCARFLLWATLGLPRSSPATVGWGGLRGECLGYSGGRSDGAQIVRRGLTGLAISNNVESDLLSLVEPLHSSAFHCADVHEDILTAVIRLDEAEALLDIEPLHGSLRHIALLSVTCVVRPRGKRSRFVRVLEESRQSDAEMRGEAKSFGRSSIGAMWGIVVPIARD
jgi:hypothetical protein